MTRFYWATLLNFVLCTGFWLFTKGPLLNWAVAGVWAVYLLACALGALCIRMKYFCPAICQGKPGTMKIALTFDDGPDPIATPLLLDLLRQENVPATFFCIGKNVDAHPQLARRIAAEGHLLGNHTYTHPWWIGFAFGPWLTREIGRTQAAIENTSGVAPRFFRPPMGVTNPHFATIAKRIGLTIVGWNVRSFDVIISAQEARDRVIRRARDGSILLLHDAGVAPDQMLDLVSGAIRQNCAPADSPSSGSIG